MLTLYRSSDCAACEEAATMLRDMRLAHRVVDATSDAVGEPPVLEDDGQRFVGLTAIAAHLEQVARVAARWQQHGADACNLCDEDGSVL